MGTDFLGQGPWAPQGDGLTAPLCGKGRGSPEVAQVPWAQVPSPLQAVGSLELQEERNGAFRNITVLQKQVFKNFSFRRGCARV